MKAMLLSIRGLSLRWKGGHEATMGTKEHEGDHRDYAACAFV